MDDYIIHSNENSDGHSSGDSVDIDYSSAGSCDSDHEGADESSEDSNGGDKHNPEGQIITKIEEYYNKNYQKYDIY